MSSLPMFSPSDVVASASVSKIGFAACRLMCFSADSTPGKAGLLLPDEVVLRSVWDDINVGLLVGVDLRMAQRTADACISSSSDRSFYITFGSLSGFKSN